MKAIPFIAALAAILAGCFPMRFTEFPGASGRVIDATTSSPIGGAEVTVALSNPQTNSGPKTVVTDSGGMFLIPPEKQWGIYIVPMDFIEFFGQLTVSARGYAPMQLDVRSSPVGPESKDYGELALERQQ